MDELETLESTFQAELAQLFGPDGQPIHVPAEHGRRLEAIEANLAAGVERINAAHDQGIAEREQAIAAMARPEPIDTLAPGELEAANSRRAFVQEDVDRLPLDQLEQRLRTLVAAGQDRATLFLFTRYLPVRLDKEKGQQDLRTARSLIDQALTILVGPTPDQARRKELQAEIDELRRKQMQARVKRDSLVQRRRRLAQF